MERNLLMLLLFCTTFVFSQEKYFENEVKKISKNIESITKTQKDSLRVKVGEINKKLASRIITLEESNQLKKSAAAYHAKRIEDLVGVQEHKLQQLVQDKTNDKIKSRDEIDTEEDVDVSFSIDNKRFSIAVEDDKDKKKKKELKKEPKNKKTTSQLVLAMGINNVLVDNQLSSLENSNYKFWQSHFYEIGWTWKTLMAKESGKMYFKYGVSFLWNNLRATNNQYHKVNVDKTDLVVSTVNLSESRLRNVQMIFPLYLELDLSKNGKYSNGRKRDKTNESIRLGVGGFAGFKLGTRQYLEYKDADGLKIEELQKGDFNTSILNYGVSGYIAYKSFGIYAKYDLNPLFKNTEIRNVSLGIRCDIL
ncbi:hypothetical protein QVZ41_06485 [Wenyingzhuangia sp. chi5]|uniref:Outer membrane protein beta-barrel domain-containing protein n=1 Tax=Wenyingzhuangia gilva TaxID=3057677 RepID=A0ABT8VRA6_9FLAO|nr:hypothetical protein [Wenyingzhuangia sp. chi5]MDO3694492.1 hypothetical protein [Wenyingzhuangia sp. chi5]